MSDSETSSNVADAAIRVPTHDPTDAPDPRPMDYIDFNGTGSGRPISESRRISHDRAPNYTDRHGATDAAIGMNPEEICSTVQAFLHSLPALEHPTQAPVTDGLYFFYERGEASQHAPDGRIVRIGNHPRSDGTLVRRLKQHYAGRKNGSVFRKFLGGALMRAEDPDHPCLAPAPGKGHWERKGEKPCHRCRPVEQSVSRLLRDRFRFRCVSISDRQERNHLEEVLIASVSACSVCQPSHQWLGQHAYSGVVRRTGIWNSQFVGTAPMSTDDLQRFADRVTSTPRQ